MKKEEEPEIEKKRISFPFVKNSWEEIGHTSTDDPDFTDGKQEQTDKQRYRQTDESDPSGSRPLFFILLKLKSREREKKDYFSSFTLFTVKLTCLNKTWVSA